VSVSLCVCLVRTCVLALCTTDMSMCENSEVWGVLTFYFIFPSHVVKLATNDDATDAPLLELCAVLPPFASCLFHIHYIQYIYIYILTHRNTRRNTQSDTQNVPTLQTTYSSVNPNTRTYVHPHTQTHEETGHVSTTFDKAHGN